MNDTNTAMRRMKRSKMLQVSSLMATAGFTLAACGSPPQQTAAAPEGEWDAPSQAYSSVQACVSSGEPALECEAAFKAASADAAETAPRFASQQDCEQEWGQGQCQQGERNGSSFFMPVLAGFMMARMMNGGQQAAARPLFQQCRTRNPDGSCREGSYRAGGAGYLARSAGRDGVQQQDGNRSRAVSRGGFGSSRGYYGG